MAYQDYSHLKYKHKDIVDYCNNVKVGDKIKFETEKQKYTVTARSDNYIICTKPFNARKTYLYTVIDLDRFVRGALSLIFGTIYDLKISEEAEKCICDLKNGEYEVSHRNCKILDIEV